MASNRLWSARLTCNAGEMCGDIARTAAMLYMRSMKSSEARTQVFWIIQMSICLTWDLVDVKLVETQT